jgi:nucleotide-binding universal stress UspA family protein
VTLATLLVPLDGSWMANRALAYATMLQRATGAHLHVLRTAPDLAHANDVEWGAASGAVDVQGGAPTADQGADPRDPVVTILSTICCRRPDLVVMASDSWSSLGLGIDVAREVARQSPAPILVIPTGMEPPRIDGYARRILVALDGSSHAEEALAPARALADALAAELLLLRVVRPQAAASGRTANGSQIDLGGARRYVEALAVSLRSDRMRVSALAVVGDPMLMIAAVSRAQHADLIAMTTRGRDTDAQSALGRVSSELLRTTGVPLLLVPPVALDRSTMWPRSVSARA